MSNLYLDPNGKEITYREWKKRIPNEYIVHTHETPKSITRLIAADMVRDANLIPAHMHKRYKMESTNILTHDAMGEPYEEPKYVEDEFAAKSFSTKEKALKEYAEFLVKWCGADRTELLAVLEKEVPVTPVPAVELKAKDMELKALGRALAEEDDSPEETEELDEDVRAKKEAMPPAPPPAPKGSDLPMTAIDDDIGSW